MCVQSTQATSGSSRQVLCVAAAAALQAPAVHLPAGTESLQSRPSLHGSMGCRWRRRLRGCVDAAPVAILLDDPASPAGEHGREVRYFEQLSGMHLQRVSVWQRQERGSLRFLRNQLGG